MNDWQHGFYKLTAAERRERLAQAVHLPSSVTALLTTNASALGNQLVENYLTD